MNNFVLSLHFVFIMVEVPDFWTPPPERENPYKIRLEELDPSCPEYIHVVAMFSDTCHSPIFSVQRVQNLGLWELTRPSGASWKRWQALRLKKSNFFMEQPVKILL